ncbi:MULTISPECIES: inorganic diphosphatase [Spiribacter]|jgi:inorganic pyrophosphatase|uniref:Inorganic pyrophosphatase n=1 Tax=Spiribacter roseus TaxID=1855875 RepID=A0ABV3RVV8_9GAMM|nr:MULTISPECIES: inorganic diphosphatase [Spiribacter]AUB79023.1 inorganic pyrophosphatase [Spiribacter roseus]KAF0281114.1 inorganic pyrophosphatase [Spiribacter roseus]KAF0284554.1 inorganic pyrophosphatase [Spiribacter roseus]KAF0286606.1 inorganic pyrophosphatase [Spiribacter sp. SSL99]
MAYEGIGAGKNLPDDINIIIEIPANADPIKYEVDKDSGAIMVDRFMGTSMHYPANYGYIPDTLCGDGDPLDALVVTPFPLAVGSVIRCRPVGVLEMTDEGGEDAKLLCVPISKLTPIYDAVNAPEDLPPLLLEQISHFFERYKDLEPGKWVRVNGWKDREAAVAEINDSIQRFGG